MKSSEQNDRDLQDVIDILAMRTERERPNPNRDGCPEAGILRDIASLRMPLSKATQYADHISTCGACCADLRQLRGKTATESVHTRERQRRWTLRRFVWAIPVLVVGVLAAIWFISRTGDQPEFKVATIDLRDREQERNVKPPPIQAPLEVRRSASHLTIYLPRWREGEYEIHVAKGSGETLLAAKGMAQYTGDILKLEVDVVLKPLAAGNYLLQIHGPGLTEQSYPLLLR